MLTGTKTTGVLGKEPGWRFVRRPVKEMQSGASPPTLLLPPWYGELLPQLTLSRQSPPASGYCPLCEGFEEEAGAVESGSVRALLSLPRDGAAPHSNGGSVVPSVHLHPDSRMRLF